MPFQDNITNTMGLIGQQSVSVKQEDGTYQKQRLPANYGIKAGELILLLQQMSLFPDVNEPRDVYDSLPKLGFVKLDLIFVNNLS